MLDSDGSMGKELRFAAIWALSEIGGEKAAAALEALLENAETDEEAEFVEEAIDNIGFGSDSLGLDFLDLESLRQGNADNDEYEVEDDDQDEETWEDDEPQSGSRKDH
jgi:hypothetical protein